MPKMQFFPHDSNAMRDSKMQHLRFKHGWAGVGMWWALCEMMANDSRQAIDFSTREDKAILANDLQLSEDECESFVGYLASLGLVRSEDLAEGRIRSERMCANALEVDARQTRAKKGAEARWGKQKASNAK